MPLGENFIQEHLTLDANYGFECCRFYAHNPKHSEFAAVRLFFLSDSKANAVVNRMRMNAGYIDTCDARFGAQVYFYSICLNDYRKGRIVPGIFVSVWDVEKADNERVYRIPLSEEEQKSLYIWVDESLNNKLGLSCADLLVKAKTKSESKYHWVWMPF